jgi:hypothetical protein
MGQTIKQRDDHDQISKARNPVGKAKMSVEPMVCEKAIFG